MAGRIRTEYALIIAPGQLGNRQMGKKESDRIDTVRLLDEQTCQLDQIRGFKKHHRIPATSGHADFRFLAQLIEPELNEELERYFALLRSAFGLKRKQISVEGPVDGGGSISTPFFCFQVFVSQLPDNAGELLWQRSISEITGPEKIFSLAFADVFGNKFSILETITTDDLDLESIVDHIEEVDEDDIKVDYDKNLTWCELEISGASTSVTIRENSIRVASRREVSPRQLVESFLEIQQRFLDTLDLNEIPLLIGPANTSK